jgi:acyl-coenzyme A thioesterase PaaI-like protein
MTIELPHTAGCLVCGRDNPHGLHLSSLVDPDTGIVSTTFSPAPHHIGFESIIHGGILATVVDELMVWSAIWSTGKACVAAELSLRFIEKAAVGRPLQVVAKITRQRSRLIETSAEIFDGPVLICSAMGKYVPLGQVETAAFLNTFVDEPATRDSADRLRKKGPAQQGPDESAR